MKKLIVVLIGMLASFQSHAAEVPHGTWSSYSKITEITSYWSFTIFKLDTTDGCGAAGDGWWKLETSSTDATKDRALEYKKSMLLAAYSGKKQVQLRCEGGAISDFRIKE